MAKAFNLVLILLVLGFLCVPQVSAQTSEISYQGSLNVSGAPANANYDFEFRLFDAVSGGTQVGSLVSKNAVAVADGVFSVNIDFGPSFSGSDRYLEIAVRPSGGGAFTFLNPRQKLVSVPYAIRSQSAANATNAITAVNSQHLGGLGAEQYILFSDPRLTDARTPSAGSANYIQNTTTQQAASNFNVTGTGTASIFNVTSRYNFNGNHLISALGSENVFVGANAGLLNTGSRNAFVGAGAGLENKGGSDNSFFGVSAGRNNITGSSNSFFGAFAGEATTSGSENSFFGHRAGLANTSGALNSFFGTFSGTFNTTGSDNSFFGNSAGFTSNGNRNSFFGSKAGNQNTAGSDNAFLGSYAGELNTTGSSNAFVGSLAGSKNATGQNNAFFGSHSGFSNTASGNSFFGMDSGYFNSTGANNSFFGRGAGRGNTVGELNVFVGIDAGMNNVLGHSNTIIGSGANVLSNSLSYATAIGAQAVVSTSNTVVLGRPDDGVRVPGNLNVLGTLTANSFSISASNLTGIVPTANGGTGLETAGTVGNFLRSNGTTWQSQPFLVGDIPAGSLNYIHNSSVQQGTSNFHISGNGTAGGTLSGNVVNSLTQYNLSGNHILSRVGIANLFAGENSGTSNTTGGSNAFFGSSAGALNTTGGGNSFFGASAGTASSSGLNNTYIGAHSGQAGTSGGNNSFLGVNTGTTNTIGSNNTLVGSNANVGANGLSYATAIGSDSVVSTSNTVVLGRGVDMVRVPGNLHVQGTLTATVFSVPAANLTGVVPVANGGTGVNAPGPAGSYLRSNGSAWTTSSIAASDITAGSPNYIQNGVGVQGSSNFNVSGTGTVGGLFSANAVNSSTLYGIGGSTVLSNPGTANIFVGVGTGTSGNDNSFFGFGAGAANSTGFSNTMIGSGANLAAGNLSFATAIGAGAVAANNNSVVLGRGADTVRVPGNLTVTGTFSAPSFTLPAANITGVIPSANGGTGISSSGALGNVLRSNGSTWASSALIASDIPNLGASYIQNGTGVQAASNFNISGNGTLGGNLVVGGTITGNFSVPAGNITGILSRANGGTGLSATGASGNFLKSDGTNWFSSALLASDVPLGSSHYIQNGTTVQALSNFNVSGNGTLGGNLVVGGTITGNFSVPAGSITGVLGFANGGTGVNSSGVAGNVLRSNGSAWTSSALLASDIPSLGASYIQNGTGLQTGNFNISGSGTIGGNLVVGGSITGGFSVPAANITGVLSRANGGTGLSSVGATGNFLRSDGANWFSSPLSASDIPLGSANYIQNGTTVQSLSNFNISGNGTVGGNLVVGGTITGSFSVPAANITGVLSRANGGTGLSAAGASGNFLRSDGTNWSSSALTASDIPVGSSNYVQNGTTVQAGTNFNVSGSGAVGTTLNVGGNLTVGGTINGTFSVNAANITGVVGAANGGTGVSSSGAAGNVLRSNGAGWTAAPLTPSDIPSLGGTYIQNGTTLQASSNFNVSGNGTIGGTASADIVNAVTQYNIGGNRVFATTGTDNIFAGAGTGTSGTSNSFFGKSAGSSNSGNSNTLIGANTQVSTSGISNSTAIGVNATATQSNSVVLGAVTGVNGGSDTSVGIGTTAPKAKLDVTGGNILVATPGQGVLLKSPDGLTCKLLSIDNAGAMALLPATCP